MRRWRWKEGDLDGGMKRFKSGLLRLERVDWLCILVHDRSVCIIWSMTMAWSFGAGLNISFDLNLLDT